MGADCAGVILNCLFCRFYETILLLRDSWKQVDHSCCPTYKQVIGTVDSTLESDDEACSDLSCGVFGSCEDTSDCLELAMEISELCYH